MKILLTGATGFLGNNLLRALLREGHTVTAAIRNSSSPRPFDGLDVDTIELDLNDSRQIHAAITSHDWVIHAAAMIQLGWSKLDESIRVNAESTRIIAEACRRKSVKMILVSTVDALAAGSKDKPADESNVDPQKSRCSYVVSKRLAEEHFCKEIEQGLQGILINPCFMVGPWDWRPSSGQMMLAVHKHFMLFAPGGGFSVADVRDVADGIASAMKHGKFGARYILGGVNMPYIELWQLMAKVIGCRGPTLRMPDWMAKIVGVVGDVGSKFTREELDINSSCIALSQLYNYYSSARAEKELGYKIGSIEDALRDSWDWFKAYGYVPS